MSPAESPSGRELLAWAAGIYLFLALGGLFWWSGGEAISIRLLVGDPSVERILWDILLGVALAGIVLLGWRAMVAKGGLPAALEAELGDLVGRLTTEEAWGLALLSGFAEELFFRGALLEAWGLLPSTLLFGLLHTGRSSPMRLWTLLAIGLGAVFALLVLWRGSLVAPTVAHVVLNGVQLRRLGSQSSDSG